MIDGSGRLAVLRAVKPVGGVAANAACPKLNAMPPEPNWLAANLYSVLAVILIAP